MEFSAPLYVVINTALWALGFAVGLISGFAVPIVGDVIAVLVVGLLVISFQSQMMPAAIAHSSWLLYTAIGLVVGTAIGFLVILGANRFDLASLSSSHIIGFPVIILVISIFQAILIRQTYPQSWVSWITASIVSILVAMLVIAILGQFINLDISQLALRETNYAATLPWALIGGILGVCYSLATAWWLRIMIS